MAEQIGKRKLTAFYVTTLLNFIVTMGAIIVSKGNLDVLGVVQLYVLVQGTLTGGFFAFNFGEHWAKTK